LYVDGSSGTLGNVAEIIGPTLQATSSSCQLQFYYHMQGAGMCTLIGTLNTIWFLGDNISPPNQDCDH